MDPYQYSPLREDRSEFRLVRLLPGPAPADIEIEIIHVPRSAKYEALSYAWGNPERTDVALVQARLTAAKPVKPLSKLAHYLRLSSRKTPSSSSTTIGITHNLAIALRHLRYEETPRVFFWIDALCINQDNVVERSVEVLDMGSIYTRAEQVVVWIGPSLEDIGLAITTLRRIGDGIFFDEGDRLCYKTNSWAQSLENDFKELKSIEPNWFAIKNLFVSRMVL